MPRGPVAGKKETPETGIASCKNVRFGGSLQAVRASAAGVFAIGRSRVNVPASRRGFFPAICSVIFALAAFAALRRIGRFKGRDRRSVAPRACVRAGNRRVDGGPAGQFAGLYADAKGGSRLSTAAFSWTAFSGFARAGRRAQRGRDCLCVGRSIGHLIVRCSDSGRCIMHRIGYCIDHCIGCRGCS